MNLNYMDRLRFFVSINTIFFEKSNLTAQLSKLGHDQVFCKTNYTKGLVQDRHFLPKCNALSKLPLLLSEGKIIKNWFWNHKTECFVASSACSFERNSFWKGWCYFYKGCYDRFTVNNMLFSRCLPVINMFLTVYYMFLTVKKWRSCAIYNLWGEFLELMGLQYKFY